MSKIDAGFESRGFALAPLGGNVSGYINKGERGTEILVTAAESTGAPDRMSDPVVMHFSDYSDTLLQVRFKSVTALFAAIDAAMDS